ncbi:hypothetical protein [Mesomycoplasma hyopneumoniae]|nr:hypothetical protein [Mesomycoplasma hyopneumoniae]
MIINKVFKDRNSKTEKSQKPAKFCSKHKWRTILLSFYSTCSLNFTIFA